MADKSLIIVESPAKVRTISKFLGGEYQVLASVGHVKDLPPQKLGVDIEHDFSPQYVTIRGKGKILAQIKKAAEKAEKVYLAPDPDREGEAICWHVAQEIRDKNKQIYRLLFNEITKSAIQEALAHPEQINQHRVDAQVARRILDRLVGYKISPLLWKKVQRGLSAGRVQSVAVRMICEREAEIEAFVPCEYWSITAKLEAAAPPIFLARLHRLDGRKAQVENQAQALELTDELKQQDFRVEEVKRQQKKRYPHPPFITSQLQQEAARKLGYSAKKTMLIAQQLYEGVETDEGPVGLITYMRTDSVRVAKEAQAEARQYISRHLGPEYLPASPPSYKSRKGAQEAHEAIRPTAVFRTPESLKARLDKDQWLLYQLIWQRFVASQLTPAVLDTTTVEIKAGRGRFRAQGSVIRFPGFMKIYEAAQEEDKKEDAAEEQHLPPLEAGQSLKLLDLSPKQHFTQPPPRYTEATLVRALEENGIGRPSTYAAILSTIVARKYVIKQKRRFHPTPLGRLVNELLVDHFPNILNIEFTAQMEDKLDRIEEGEADWVESLRQFYQPFSERLKLAEAKMRNVKQEVRKTELSCPQCGRELLIKWGRNGEFLACSGYPECRYTSNFSRNEQGEIQLEEVQETGELCPQCNQALVIKNGRYGKFLACSNYPRCRFSKPITTGVACPQNDCSGYLTPKRSKKGRIFYGCSNYPRCRFALWDKPVAEECPQCGADFLLERFQGGDKRLYCHQPECGYRREVGEEG
jgi:DNA topoisomerase-1